MNKQLVAQVTFAVLVCVALVGLTRCGADRAPEAAAPDANSKPIDPALRMASLTSLMDDAEANRETRITVARQVATQHSDEATRRRAGEIVDQLAEEIRVANLGKQWSYNRRRDPMTSAESIQAVVHSTNTHDLGFPYGGAQRATLVLRKHPTYGSDIIFSIERGQLLCSSYSDCPIRVRFDEGTARTLNGNDAADHSTETIFIPGYKDFVSHLSRSKKLLVEANVYQRGAPIWEFDVEGFEPEQMQ